MAEDTEKGSPESGSGESAAPDVGVAPRESTDKQKVLEEFIEVVNASASATFKSEGKFVNDTKEAETKLRAAYANAHGGDVEGARNLSDSDLIAFTKECTRRIKETGGLADKIGLDIAVAHPSEGKTGTIFSLKEGEINGKKGSDKAGAGDETTGTIEDPAGNPKITAHKDKNQPEDIYDRRGSKDKKPVWGNLPDGETLADFFCDIPVKWSQWLDEITRVRFAEAKISINAMSKERAERTQRVLLDDGDKKGLISQMIEKVEKGKTEEVRNDLREISLWLSKNDRKFMDIKTARKNLNKIGKAIAMNDKTSGLPNKELAESLGVNVKALQHAVNNERVLFTQETIKKKTFKEKLLGKIGHGQERSATRS